MDGDKKVYFAPLWLVRQGQAAVQICIPADASEAVLAAAKDLQSHVKQISGAELPICREGESLYYSQSVHIGYTEKARELGQMIEQAAADAQG